MTTSLIEFLADYCGIESNYTDAWGMPAEIDQSTKQKLLKAMGYKVGKPDELQSQIEEFINSSWLTPLNPVQVVRTNQSLHIAIRLPIELVTDSYEVQITTEQGGMFSHPFTPIEEGQLANVTHIQNIEFQEYIIDLPFDLALGYHSLRLVIGDDELANMRLIIAPVACFKPEPLLNGENVWGISAQLYSLRSETNWGVGDFTDLCYLVEKAAKQGAHFIGLNPIHALYPADPDSCNSYGFSSRHWLNFIYIDVTILDGFQQPSVQGIVNHADFQNKLNAARDTEHVDYKSVTELKLQTLDAIFEYQNAKYLSKNTKLNKSFNTFVAEGGDSLQTLTIYDALQESLMAQGKPCLGWPFFPKEFSDFTSTKVKTFAKKNAIRVKFYLWLQWQAALQLEQVNMLAKNNNMHVGLCRDLGEGVSEDGAEVWGNKGLYCTGASVGAPPDALNSLGKNWELPPMNPEMLYQQQYQPIIELFSANMHATGALRIGHVMTLLRLWWIAKGDDEKSGGYVYYPVDELLGILALESCRHQSLVIGEGLDSVPESIRQKLADNGVYSYREFFFEQAKDGDIDTNVDCMSMSQELNFIMQQLMATGSSELLSLQLEDWLQMDKPVNNPRILNEDPKWRRKLTRNLQDIFADTSLNHLAVNLMQVHKKHLD